MKKYFFVAIGVMLVAFAYQNCDSGGDSLIKGSRNSTSGGGDSVLSFSFTYATQYVPTNQTNIFLQGNCTADGYKDHRVDWEYTFKGVRYQGRTDRPCTSGSFALVIPVNQLSRADNDQFNFKGKITGVKNGVATPGPESTLRVVFSSSMSTGTGTTGSTTGSTSGNSAGTTGGNTAGGTTGNTTGEDHCAGATGNRMLFCGMCQDEGRDGVTEYCSNNYSRAEYCLSYNQPPNRQDMVDLVAVERPDLLEDCARNAAANSNWNGFTTEVIRRLRAEGLPDSDYWGFNGVRGNTNDINGDTISYWGKGGVEQEGGDGGVVIDIIIDCGGSNRPAWQVLNPYCGCCTDMVAWTLGGRF